LKKIKNPLPSFYSSHHTYFPPIPANFGVNNPFVAASPSLLYGKIKKTLKGININLD